MKRIIIIVSIITITGCDEIIGPKVDCHNQKSRTDSIPVVDSLSSIVSITITYPERRICVKK